MTTQKTAIVVGGGIAGLVSALLLRSKFPHVYLIERENKCGGLLQSLQNDAGVFFDYGAHLMKQTSISELNTLLFQGIIEEGNWHILEVLKAGNYFRGKLNDRSPFINTTLLPKEIYTQGVVEALSLCDPNPPAHNLEEYLNKYFGEVFTTHVFRPAILKLFGSEPKELAPHAHALFGLTRILALTPNASRELKKSPVFDAKFAFHSFHEGVSGIQKYYPKRGGIGLYTDLLVRKLEDEGVHILTGETVQHVEHQNRKVTSVRLESQKSIGCDLLVWTVPLHLLTKASKIEIPFPIEPPQLRGTSLHHFVFDAPFQTDLFYLTCYDPAFSSFRITLYPNIGGEPRKEPPYNCTVEVLFNPTQNPSDQLPQIAQELVDMEIVPKSAKILYQQSDTVKQGFPILTNKFVEHSDKQLTFMEQTFENVLFLGKGSTSSFFLNDVLCDTYTTITNLA